MRRRLRSLVSVGLVTALAVAACGDDDGSKASTPTNESTIETAPDSARVDLAEPSFSSPTEINNPLFPITDLTQVVQLGEEGGEPLRAEVTLLPETKTIDVNGEPVEAIVSQYVAYLDNQIAEVAYDYFAQADDGSVWYLGEDVDNYEDGVIADHEGTWLSGRDGPAGMIMPASPQVGDVYRPENIPDLVFEEVVVQATDETVDGPQGPITGALVVEEHPMDGTLENKTFAPGYGEFRARAQDELLTVAIGAPIDAVGTPLPAELGTIFVGATDVFGEAIPEAWDVISGTLENMTAAWEAYQTGGVPPLLETAMNDALDVLDGAVADRDVARTQQAALDAAFASLDLRLRHQAPADVDRYRVELWTRQRIVDAEAGNDAAVAGDEAAIETITARLP
jgi:hypothetical protein